ncbi:090R [Invertebrate iridescent virus Kaz2018]|uniref:090R n=1 Tax=Invertebrate iridescent virus 6 TaxID=176652 RepID=Q91G24_IIV6|nr:090R [Invertebrate iridescent virus 6]AAK82008.1 090R [Invertebrate iridescent virus 6]QMS79508.1 hypothetical protein IIV6-T1_094 [Invertebrate iridescent virus 6]QNH08500.1 090R [Invertebrate iridescent virus Kaz2018]
MYTRNLNTFICSVPEDAAICIQISRKPFHSTFKGAINRNVKLRCQIQWKPCV